MDLKILKIIDYELKFYVLDQRPRFWERPKELSSKNERPQRGIGVNDGDRTHDNRNHNPGLYRLSYVHH